MVRRDAAVRTISLGFFVMVVFAALDNVALVPFGRGVLHGGDFLVGLLLTGYGVFMVLGPMALGRAGGRFRMELALYAAYLALGVGTVLTGLSPVIAVAFVGQAIAGAGAGWCHIAVDTLIQQHVPARSLGRAPGWSPPRARGGHC